MFEKYLSLALEKLTCSSDKSPILMLGSHIKVSIWNAVFYPAYILSCCKNFSN